MIYIAARAMYRVFIAQLIATDFDRLGASLGFQG
jgi:hypothetical protein